MARITKDQLLAKIDALEAQLGMANKTLEEYERELNGLYVQQRPSRVAPPPVAPVVTETVVVIRGVPHRKVRAWEHGRIVTTYKPLAH